MNKPEFGMQFRVNPLKVDFDACEITHQVRVASAESLDDAVVSEICKIAREDGVNTLIVLDKKNIRTALERATAKKPTLHVYPYDATRGCPTCGHMVLLVHKYCSECGQKLDWGKEE